MKRTTRQRRVRLDLSFEDAVNLHDILSSAWVAIDLDREHRRSLSHAFDRMERQIHAIDALDLESGPVRTARKPKEKK